MSGGLQSRSPERWAAFASLLIAVALWIGPWLLRVDLFYDDAAHHVFWLYRGSHSGPATRSRVDVGAAAGCQWRPGLANRALCRMV